MEETKLFFITYFAALLGVLPPGLVNMSVAKTCVERGKRSGIFFAIGASLIVFCQATVAILLAKYIFNHPFVRNILLRTGLVIFSLLAIYFFIAAKKEKTKLKIAKKSSAKSFLSGMMIAVLNVFPIPYFVALSTAFNAKGTYEYHAVSVITFALGAAIGTFSTLYIYVVSFVNIEKHTQKFAKYSNYFMATLMLVLVIIALIRIYCY